MGKMIERVAQAIENAANDVADPHEAPYCTGRMAEAAAKAAIAAMREPTDEMIHAGVMSQESDGPVRSYVAMINAALKPI